MKKMFIFSVLAMLFVVASCNKDQKAVKTLEGKWFLVKENGQNVSANETSTLTFSKCKLKSEDYCNLVIEYKDSDFGDDETYNAEYKTLNDGETLEIKTSFDGESYIQQLKIRTLEKEKLVLEQTEDGETYLGEYKKI